MLYCKFLINVNISSVREKQYKQICNQGFSTAESVIVFAYIVCKFYVFYYCTKYTFLVSMSNS